jgi:hypothetical protein
MRRVASLDLPVGCRRCAIENDLTDTGRIFQVEAPAERQESLVALVPLRDRLGHASATAELTVPFARD